MKISVIISVISVLVVGLLLFYFFGTTAPTVSLTPAAGPIAARKNLTLKLDAGSAILKSVTVSATQEGRTINLLAKGFPAGGHGGTETFTLAQGGLKEGPFTLQVKAISSAPRFGADRTSSQTHSFVFENKPPVVAVLTTAHNITQGGAGLVVYTVSKEVEKTGVVFADRFIPGYRQKGNVYVCLFPFPYNMNPNQYVPKVTAIDRAGNERVVTINYHLIPKSFRPDRINLTDSFLDKIASEFKDRFPQITSPLELFLKVNREVRQQDRNAIAGYGRQTSPVPLWQDTFLRMPNAAPLGGYAQFRTYIYQGKEVDQQTHLGFDLASVAHAPVPAANSGKVVYAGDLGIYGQCIVIDHGLGMQTLYGHLSQIGIKAGDKVDRGQIIGNTGATGMAAGDHLHFEVALSGESVNPIEWWDPSWIKNNVTSKLELVNTVGK